MVDKIENVLIEVSIFLRIQSNVLLLIVSLLMLHFVFKCMLLRKYKDLLSVLVSQIYTEEIFAVNCLIGLIFAVDYLSIIIF